VNGPTGMELWELFAREQIRDLVARYNTNGDAGRLEEATAVFTDDARVEFIEPGSSTLYIGRAEVYRMMTEVKNKWSEAAKSRAEALYVRHFVASHQIDVIDECNARGRCYVAVIKAHGLDHWGRYIDEYRREDERWLISARRAITDDIAEGEFR
jgi:hypothetical protein